MPFPELKAFHARHANATAVAFIGGAVDEQTPAIERWLHGILAPLSGNAEILVVTGGTAGGVPGAATRIAHQLGFPVLGVLPERGRKHIAPVFADRNTDRVCCVVVPPLEGESEWGDATPLLVRCSDVLIPFGGEWGTAVEIATVLKVNDTLLYREQKGASVDSRWYKRILPLASFLGPAQHAQRSPWLTDELRAVTFPYGDLASLAAVNDVLLAIDRDMHVRTG
jgi:predicted Rossmann-fold nucleotide-binding protein